jgi:hypothetical protein
LSISESYVYVLIPVYCPSDRLFYSVIHVASRGGGLKFNPLSLKTTQTTTTNHNHTHMCTHTGGGAHIGRSAQREEGARTDKLFFPFKKKEVEGF